MYTIWLNIICKRHNVDFFVQILVLEAMTAIETIMPFLQHLISQSAKGSTDLGDKKYVQTYVQGKIKTVRDMRGSDYDVSGKLLVYRNSLMVNNHFKPPQF